MPNIRLAKHEDRDAIWRIFHEVVAAGDTYTFDPGISREHALAYWFADGTQTYVAELANAAFMVAPEAQGKGIGRAMAEHCLAEARRLGFRAMQFNFVISTNESAVHLWKQLGFEIVGTLPGAFKHPQKGFVDVYVMFRSLE